MNSTKNNRQLSDEQISFLAEEISLYTKNPDEGSSWIEIKNRIKNKTSGSLRLRGKKK